MPSHDQLFKELLRLFFREFLELFFPAVAAQLNFATVRFLEQEVFTDFPGGDVRRADTVVEIQTIRGTPEVVLFHVEAERLRRSEFRARMWEYYNLLTDRLKKPIYPIGIYLSPGAGGLVVEEYKRELFGLTILSFNYQAVGLPDLAADDYLTGSNLVGIALSSLMKPGVSSSDIVARKWKAVQTILRSQTSESGKVLLANIVEKYLPLSQTETVQYEQIMATEATTEERQLMSVWELRGLQQGIQKGIQQGIQQGIHQGQQSLILRQMTAKYGALPTGVVSRVEAMDETELSLLAERILTVPTLDELGLLA